jgi:serine/threonine protein kinase
MIIGYQILDRIYTGSKTEIYRAIDPTDLRRVAIKVSIDPYPTGDRLLQFRNQYTIAHQLHHPQIIETYSLEPYKNGYALVMEDYGGISLREWLTQTQPSIATTLQIAIDLSDALQELSRHRIVHKNINPANILIHPDTHQVKSIDFSIAALLPKETLEIHNPNILEGTLPYIAPEQTGRMNRGINHRCDLYSLGVTCYELLTGKLPFDATEPIGWIHCHLARIAIPVDRIVPAVPSVLARIIAKLMAKNPEDRYQSALGLKYDLAQCLAQWQATGTISEFELAQRDMSDRFLIPARLYGRESAVQILLDSFNRVAAGNSELMLVAGGAGIGKTTVINEIHQPITHQQGYFIAGKFDQFNRDLPFSAFIQGQRLSAVVGSISG